MPAGSTAARWSTPIEQVLKPALGKGRHVTVLNTNDIYFEPGVYDKMLKSRELMTGGDLGDPVAPRDRARVPQRGNARRRQIDGSAAARRGAELFPRTQRRYRVRDQAGMDDVAAAGTTHGSPNADDQHVPILFYGRGVKPGIYTQPATPADSRRRWPRSRA